MTSVRLIVTGATASSGLIDDAIAAAVDAALPALMAAHTTPTGEPPAPPTVVIIRR